MAPSIDAVEDTEAAPTADFALGMAATAGPIAQTATPEARFDTESMPPADQAIPTVGWRRDTSPDGRWIAEFGASESVSTTVSTTEARPWSGYYRRLRFLSPSRALTHTALSEWTEDGIPRLEPAFIGWSRDGRHAFFFEKAAACCCPHVDSGLDLQRTDLDTGETEYLASGISTARMAPGRDAIAYIPGAFQPGDRMEILDLTTGAVQSSDSFSGLAREVVWAPGSGALAAIIQTSPCENPEQVWSTLLRIDRDSGETTQLLPPVAGALEGLRWVDEAVVELMSPLSAVMHVDIVP